MQLIKCPRCQGRKKLYKVGSAYSFQDTGGVLIDCPMCLGVGQTKSLEEALDNKVIGVIHEGSDTIPDELPEPIIESGIVIKASIKSKTKK